MSAAQYLRHLWYWRRRRAHRRVCLYCQGFRD